jgi:A/G-specific adenine glycosylase
MEDTSKIKLFQKKILSWYATNRRIFYWRKKRLSNYQYIIAEVLLQRTKAETIAKFYPIFIKHFPNWKSLANADPNDIAQHLKPIGLYTQKANRVKQLAVEMVRRGGRLPKDRIELESIPFMGQYLANAVELIIFNNPSPLIDVNMSRVLERFFGPRKMADIRYDPYLQLLSKKIVGHSKSKEINWAILDFAAMICKAKSPLHETCPLREQCTFYKAQVISK